MLGLKNSTGRILVRKPLSLSVLTHGCSPATRKPTRHLLTMPYILVRIGAPYEGWWSSPFHLPRNYGIIFKPKKNLLYYFKVLKYQRKELVIINTVSYFFASYKGCNTKYLRKIINDEKKANQIFYILHLGIQIKRHWVYRCSFLQWIISKELVK